MSVNMPSPQKPIQKRGNSPNAWILCETCNANIISKDIDIHVSECPPNLNEISHNFLLNGDLYGTVDTKINEDIKGLTPQDKDNIIFLSQSAIQLCNLSIGDYALIENQDKSILLARTVWPTCEKTLASVLFTKNGLEISCLKPTEIIKVSKICRQVNVAQEIIIIILNGPKSMELSSELQNRLHKSHVGKIISTNNVLSILFYGKMLKFMVKSIRGAEVSHEYNVMESRNLRKEFANLSFEETHVNLYKINEKTNWKLFKNETDYKKEMKTMQDPYQLIGGLMEEIIELEDLINCSLGIRPSLSGFKLTKGALLHGNSGTGKTLLANAVALQFNVHTVKINSSDLYSKFSSNIEEAIKNMFTDAIEHAPTIILLDEVDILCPSRSSKMTESEKRIVSSILTLLDEVNNIDCKIFVLATSNKPDSIDGAFRRAGRLEREIEISVPTPSARFDIILKLLSTIPNNIGADLVKEIANITHGFVGADLVALVSNAALHATKKYKTMVDYEDFKVALNKVRPSAMREVQIEVPNVKWTDIGGQENLKLILKQCVEWPLKHADSFIRMGITPPRGVLMYGPPGCSKTMIAKALATESGLNFLAIKGPELFSKWVGESERAVREVFRKARQVAPSIVFFDEIDALGGERTSGSSTSVQERVLAQLLTELDGVTPLGDVTVLAATNRPDCIDKALLRPGRLDRIVYVPLPSEETRMDIFRIKLSKMPVYKVDIKQLVIRTRNYSGAEVNAVCHEAAMMALEEDLNASLVHTKHFEKALELITPRTPDSLLKIYKDYQNNKF